MKKFIKDNSHLMVFITLMGMSIAWAKKDAINEMLRFSSTKIQLKTEEFINALPTDAEKVRKAKLEERKFLIDSLNKADAIKSRKFRDSIMLLNAVDMSIIKQEMSDLKNQVNN